jgi:hypothetical protein
VNGVNHNIVGLDGTGTFPLNFIVITPLFNNGGLTNTYALAPTSIARDTGDSSLNPAAVGPNDQRGTGFPRTSSGLMDIGAVEE